MTKDYFKTEFDSVQEREEQKDRLPLVNFFNTPVLVFYRLKDGTKNVMTNGAWCWYSKRHQQGTIHEFGNHSFTYDNAEDIEYMTMVFVPPSEQGALDLDFCGNTSLKEGVNKFEQFLDEIDEETLIHVTFPTWVVEPIDCHQVSDLFKLVSTKFISQHNGFPHHRVVDQDRTFYEVILKEIDINHD